jgi:cystathionine beta-lyase
MVKGLTPCFLPVQTVFCPKCHKKVHLMSQSNKPGESSRKKNIDTRLMHMGSDPDQYYGFVNTPLHRGSTILYPTLDAYLSRSQKYTYGRRGTPTIEALESTISELESGAHTALTPSGLSACTVSLLAIVKSGGHILITDSVYQPVRKLSESLLRRLGVEITYYDPHIGSGISELIQDNTQLIYTESPGSQTFEIQDLPAICEAAKVHGIPVLTDNTWASPLYYNPLKLGADVVIHAGTKYFSGHSDANLGSITTTEDYADVIRLTHGNMGQCPGPEDVNLCLRGIRTLSIRLARHEKSAFEMADWLEQRPEVIKVMHPARKDHPDHELWKRDFTGSSGLFSIIIDDASDNALGAMLDGLELFGMGASWGGYESLIIPFNAAAYRTATSWEAEGRALRFHIGLEDVEDLKADLNAGFERLRAEN